MVRLQGDFAKPEKRFNYKNCFDARFRVRLSDSHSLPFPRFRVLLALFDDVFGISCEPYYDLSLF